MKTIMAFFAAIWAWIVGLFASKKKTETKITTKVIPPDNKPSIFSRRGKYTPPHNNRKSTRGRYTQYIDMGNGQQRAIFHGRMSERTGR